MAKQQKSQTDDAKKSSEGGGEKAYLNFTVDEEFKWEFREFAVRHRRKQVDLLREAFQDLKIKYGEK